LKHKRTANWCEFTLIYICIECKSELWQMKDLKWALWEMNKILWLEKNFKYYYLSSQSRPRINLMASLFYFDHSFILPLSMIGFCYYMLFCFKAVWGFSSHVLWHCSCLLQTSFSSGSFQSKWICHFVELINVIFRYKNQSYV